MVVYYENAMCMLLKSQCLIVWQLYVESEYVIVDFMVYIYIYLNGMGITPNKVMSSLSLYFDSSRFTFVSYALNVILRSGVSHYTCVSIHICT